MRNFIRRTGIHFTGFRPGYHHTTDTPEKIDHVKMTTILKLDCLTAWQFGAEAETPQVVANLARK